MRVVNAVCGMFVVGILLVIIMAWPAMILLGIAHSFDARIPAFGLWTVFFLGWSVRLLTASATTNKG